MESAIRHSYQPQLFVIVDGANTILVIQPSLLEMVPRPEMALCRPDFSFQVSGSSLRRPTSGLETSFFLFSALMRQLSAVYHVEF